MEKAEDLLKTARIGQHVKFNTGATGIVIKTTEGHHQAFTRDGKTLWLLKKVDGRPWNEQALGMLGINAEIEYEDED